MMAIRVRQPTRGRAVIGMGMEPPGAACYARSHRIEQARRPIRRSAPRPRRPPQSLRT
jgi:hypothetical protein